MQLPVRTINEVAERQLCCGCGACEASRPDAFRMVDAERGRRPLRRESAPDGADEEALSVCPGVRLEHTFDRADPALDRSLLGIWGPVREVWEGWAADPEIRRRGSSGGAATALATHAVERGGAYGVLHTQARHDAPYLNTTVLSRTRAEMLAGAGSRYAPASPCEGVAHIEAADGPCVFIGKPCDVAGVQALRKQRPELDRRLQLVIGFFCAGTPSTRGTLDLLRKVGVEDPSTIESLRYRGNGWPGRWTVHFRTEVGVQEASLSYEESWDFLQRYRQWRCHICPDHTGEFADVAVADAWYRKIEPGEPGCSLIVVRTERGAESVRRAAEDGYLILSRRDSSMLPDSQANLARARGSLWGRLMALRAARIPTPVYRGFPLFGAWARRLTMKQRLQSFYGTWKRVRSRGLRRRTRIEPLEPILREGAEGKLEAPAASRSSG